VPKFKDITNQRFGGLVAMWPCGTKTGHIYWLCACDCGQYCPIRPDALVQNGQTQCKLCSDKARPGHLPKHGHASSRRSPTYRSWNALKNRCFNPKAPKYKSYGAKGITVCPRWRESFEAFLADVGERPLGTTIDRIDGSKGYLCGRLECCGQNETNCRWATPAEQKQNQNAVKLTPAKVRDIRTKRTAGETYKSIASAYNIDSNTARSAAIGETWVNVS